MFLAQRNVIHFLGALFFTLTCGFYFDLHSSILHLLKTKQTITTLKNEVKTTNELLAQKNVFEQELVMLKQQTLRAWRSDQVAQVTTELLTIILKMAEGNGLTVQSIQPLANQLFSGGKTIDVQLKAIGHFAAFTTFIRMLSAYELPIVLTHFTLNLLQNGNLEMNLQFTGFYVPTADHVAEHHGFRKIDSHVIETHDPFRLRNDSAMLLSDDVVDNDKLLRTVSLQQMKWVGYVHSNHTFWGLVKLPSGKTISFTIDKRLGIENARVVKLNENEIEIEIAGQQVKYFF